MSCQKERLIRDQSKDLAALKLVHVERCPRRILCVGCQATSPYQLPVTPDVLGA